MVCKLLSEGIHGIIIDFIIGQLLFEILDPFVEASLQLTDVELEVFHFLLVIHIDLILPALYLSFVLFELALACNFLLIVSGLEFHNHLLRVAHLFGLLDLGFILGDHCVALIQDGFDFLLVCVCESDFEALVFLVFRVQMEDDFGQLGNLLAHLHLYIVEILHFKYYELSNES